jgi:hypothetical protein
MISDERAIKTIFGAIHYTCQRYNRVEEDQWDLDRLAGYLHIKITTYCIEVDGTGFVLTTRLFRMRYVHHDFEQRMIEIKFYLRFMWVELSP